MYMHRWSPEDQMHALEQERRRVTENMEADRLAATAWEGRTKLPPRLGWLLVVLLAAAAVIWFLGGNTPSLVAGAIAAAVALGLAIRLLQMRAGKPRK